MEKVIEDLLPLVKIGACLYAIATVLGLIFFVAVARWVFKGFKESDDDFFNL